MRRMFVLSALLFTPSVALAQAELPELLRAAIAPNEALPSFTFDIKRTSTNTGGDTETRTGYARVDMGAPEFKQITPAHLIDPEQPGSSFNALSGIENAIEDGIWCSGLIDTPPDPTDVEVVAEDADTVTYQFEPAASEDADGPEKKILKRSLATVVVSRENPAILSFQQTLTKTVTLYVVAKVRMVELSATCARAPGGHTYIQNFTNAFEASGFGDGGGNQSEMTITSIYDSESGLELAAN